MEWLNIDEAVFYGATWTIGFLASLFASLGSSDSESARKCVYRSGISGFLAFAVVAVFVGRVTGPIIGHWYFLGIAALIGLAGNQQEYIRKTVTDFFMGRFNGKN